MCDLKILKQFSMVIEKFMKNINHILSITKVLKSNYDLLTKLIT
jgi:hypothetical protein